MLKRIAKMILPAGLRRTLRRGAEMTVAYILSPLSVKKNKVVFINVAGRGFGCNPKYIALEMLRQQLPVDLVWLVSKDDPAIPHEVRQVRWGSLSMLYELATAGVIITNVKSRIPFIKKKEQLLIQTWHGSNAYKCVEAEIIEEQECDYIKDSKVNSAITDVFISDSPYTSQWYRDAFWCHCDIWETGMPRNDVYCNMSAEAMEALRKSLGIAQGKKIWMYAPTFRDFVEQDTYKLNFEAVQTALQQHFGGEWVGLLRLHPIVNPDLFPPSDAEMINVSSFGDPQELFALTDALISDYSSLINDFIMMKKPVFLYTPDYDSYIARERQLKQIYFDLPLRRNRTDDELCADILAFHSEKYQEDMTSYWKNYGCILDGKASERVVERLKKFIL
ncbi:hypothetical protein HMPREF9334_01846 [Selenomonas infelix ATCC 43532]|uniref:CDP-glycerol:poly(Glycerophosphate) glycerophosphotransferase n=1 Tax=Selenomonas infelix ATCC 43532 TaxID=679201 RepID=G5GRG5_9FIRM|nr:CDP-glycerol glycerophosphotransferase family protein [Selenomonas infelix]EHG19531.1 hypothetical protein HMPREF9334_01846 [Selenomonas infelix ATCC 43532]